MGRRLRFSQDTSDSSGLASPLIAIHPSAYCTPGGTRGDDESLHVDTHHNYVTVISDHALFRGSIIPYLETNMLRPRLRAIKTRPAAYRGAAVQ
jgi:hypothetical protein